MSMADKMGIHSPFQEIEREIIISVFNVFLQLYDHWMDKGKAQAQLMKD